MSENIVVCPICQTENDALSRTCADCGESLVVVCPHCNTVTTVTAGQCSACGQRFDTLGQIMARHEVRLADRFTRQAGAAIETRSGQKAEDQARSQQLWEQERQRQAYLLAQKQRQKQQERYLVIGVTIAAVILLGMMALIALTR